MQLKICNSLLAILAFSNGRRVSDLLDKFEERGATIDDGGTGGSHILKPGGGSEYLGRQSNFNFSSTRLSGKTSEKILKLNINSKSNFKLRCDPKDSNTESRVERDWLKRSANGKPGSRKYGL